MSDFLYKLNEPPHRPFARGDLVYLVDSQGFQCSEPLKIKRAGKRIVTTECGRRYLQNDGRWFADGRAWPFPWIRLPNSADGERK